jgi:hypothetical protein
MKVTIEEEIHGKERRSINIYEEGSLCASSYLEEGDNPCRILEIVKGLCERLF